VVERRYDVGLIFSREPRGGIIGGNQKEGAAGVIGSQMIEEVAS